MASLIQTAKNVAKNVVKYSVPGVAGAKVGSKVANAVKNNVKDYGPGQIKGTREYGISEMLGGKTNSVQQAKNYQTFANEVNKSRADLQTKNNSPKGEVAGVTTQRSGGGGSSSGSNNSYTTAINPVTGEEQYYDSERQAIDALYKDSMGFLNNQEASLRAGEQDFYNQYTQPFDAQVPLIQQALQEGQGKINNAVDVARNDEQGALAQARRLYNELSQRNQQQFGGVGGSSAGQASSEIAGRELQRNVGNINRQTGQQVQELMTQSRDLEARTNAELQSLEYKKQAALSQARDEFRMRLDEINSAKSEVGQNKAQARLALMQDFRQRIQGINDQVRTVQMNLEMAKQQAQMELQNSLATITAYSQGIDPSQGLTNLNSMNTSSANQYSTYGNQPLSMGAINNYSGRVYRPEDENTSLFASARNLFA